MLLYWMGKETEVQDPKMKNLWVKKDGAASEDIDRLRDELNGVHSLLCSILLSRGVKNRADAELYFRPKLEDLHDPFLMADMKKAVDRIESALEKNQGIMVLGDYDVDGTTSAAMVYLFLRSRTSKVFYYIPDRYSEGYGISIQSIDTALKEDCSLMICLDCGIKATDKVAYANQGGLDMIICDHHRPGDDLPEALAVLDPKRQDCDYPFKELSGCGVGFKLIQAVLKSSGSSMDEAFRYLDLLAISIAADIVPITGENRTLAFYGLQKVNSDPLPGIRALKESTNFKSPFRTSDLVFKLAPRINAAGRMASGRKAVEIMVEADIEKGRELAGVVGGYNEERGETDKRITDEAMEQAVSDSGFSQRKTSVFYGPHWHKGVIGIVASRMIEQFYRPTVVFCGEGEVLSGSARSVRHFDIYKALEECGDLLIQFGGHKYAAGMTIKRDMIQSFREKFEKVVSDSIGPESLQAIIEIDGDLDIADIRRDFFKVLKRFAPFGPGNMNPVFKSDEAVVTYVNRVGKEGEHLKLQLSSPSDPLKALPAIAFGLGHLAGELVQGQLLSVVYTIEENTWNGNSEIQLNIKDIRV